MCHDVLNEEHYSRLRCIITGLIRFARWHRMRQAETRRSTGQCKTPGPETRSGERSTIRGNDSEERCQTMSTALLWSDRPHRSRTSHARFSDRHWRETSERCNVRQDDRKTYRGGVSSGRNDDVLEPAQLSGRVRRSCTARARRPSVGEGAASETAVSQGAAAISDERLLTSMLHSG